MYADREVFSNAPLELVAMEIRFPFVAQLRHLPGIEPLADAMRDLVPVLRQDQVQTVTISPSGSGAQVENLCRLLNKSSTISVTFQPTKLTIETTDYPQFPAFLNLATRAVEALVQTYRPVAVERVGLRFIDEVRVPSSIQQASDWSEWVDSSLISMTSIHPTGRAVTAQGFVQYDTGEQTHLMFRFAALTGTSVIGESALRRRRRPQTGPFFLLDMDSYWEPAGDLPEFDPNEVLRTIESLHDPIGETFQRAITDRLKDEVLRSTDAVPH